ncbi:uncharacterized protein LOC108891664 isoform X2 [Lates calcarifer]|uniref:Uncharacterized protein LOC108891664 isoform X2 n=1 Tax=Lates calcarifer TaxID=8187 RepID=A0A4W6C1S0_LATCA|nr:uncharacterized protein LOC108891664 isoform X2 [Lates calcarifer]
MMWEVVLMFFTFVQAQVISQEIISLLSVIKSPSFLADLKVELVTEQEKDMLNISWAISIDASTEYLTGTLIEISGEPSYLCDYSPHLTCVTGLEQKWFNFLVQASYGFNLIQASNLPWPQLGSGVSSKSVSVLVPRRKTQKSVTLKPSQVPRGERSHFITVKTTPDETTTSSVRKGRITVTIFGGLAILMILSSCYIIYKSCGANIASSLGFRSLPQSPTVPVPVLVVYPAKNSAFQRAVVALAEFLQWHGGCSVAIDMWQQGKIAELGPMRWLTEQAKAAEQVLIVCPQPSSQPSHSPPNRGFPEPSIPAAAHDLYPLILNMVASHAKSANDLAKFWVVQLGKQRGKRHSNLALELRACKTFYLMKDLNKLYRSLHSHRQDDRKISDQIFRPRISYSEKSTVMLREAVEEHFQRSRSTENCGHLSLNISNENV